ncbi:MAG: WYL domain-containing protein, partial [Candidatus Omnitrophica bacterium]|nr:WYL domain-containing protein [Candidatus Omnitrophota bacterium]
LQEAIDLGLKLKIRYFSSKDAQITEREVIPKQIKQQNDRFYLIGFCLLRNEERSFNIDGILHIEIV